MSLTRTVGRSLLASAVSIALTVPFTVSAEGVVNVYSARQEGLIKPLLDEFSAETGIQVQLVTASAPELLQRLRLEGRRSPADVLITVDAGNLNEAAEAGIFRATESAVLTENVPSAYRDAEGEWFGLSLRARPIMVAKDRVTEDALETYDDLTDEQWRGKICVRSSSNVYNQSMLAAMISRHGSEAAEAWARGIVANMARPPQGGDRDQIMAVADGACDIAIANTYYLGGMLAGSDESQRAGAEKIHVIFPNQDSTGTHVNVSGAGVLKHAPNPENAVKLLEFLVSQTAQTWYAEANQEYPVRPDVEPSNILRGFGEFKMDDLPLDELGVHQAEALRIFDRVGWR
ncbi:MAG: Fe(3+) ABC transporter substrate-binding protein [Thioalkalivibrionaceae bacterium]